MNLVGKKGKLKGFFSLILKTGIAFKKDILVTLSFTLHYFFKFE
jgi:hypothetical protein